MTALDLALVLSAALLGLAGTPHCAAMCAAPCAALGGAWLNQASGWAFHGGRLLSYVFGGALAAGSVASLAGLAQLAPAVRPLWALLHAAALGLGLWMVWQGRQPAWLLSWRNALASPAAPTAAGWQRLHGPVRAGTGGALWLGWPCGLLQSALVMAALANSVLGGAAVMAAFATTSATGLVLGPALLLRLSRGRAPVWQGHAIRLAGAMLAAASAWALGHDTLRRVAAYCLS